MVSAQAHDIRIRKTLSKHPLKEKVYNYEHFIGGVDMGLPATGSVVSIEGSSRPMSAVVSKTKLTSRVP